MTSRDKVLGKKNQKKNSFQWNPGKSMSRISHIVKLYNNAEENVWIVEVQPQQKTQTQRILFIFIFLEGE